MKEDDCYWYWLSQMRLMMMTGLLCGGWGCLEDVWLVLDPLEHLTTLYLFPHRHEVHEGDHGELPGQRRHYCVGTRDVLTVDRERETCFLSDSVSRQRCSMVQAADLSPLSLHSSSFRPFVTRPASTAGSTSHRGRRLTASGQVNVKSLFFIKLNCVSRASGFKHIFWSIIVCVAMGCAAIFLYSNTIDFMNATVVTTVDTMTVPLSEVFFPSVVVCNINQVQQISSKFYYLLK